MIGGKLDPAGAGFANPWPDPLVDLTGTLQAGLRPPGIERAEFPHLRCPHHDRLQPNTRADRLGVRYERALMAADRAAVGTGNDR